MDSLCVVCFIQDDIYSSQKEEIELNKVKQSQLETQQEQLETRQRRLEIERRQIELKIKIKTREHQKKQKGRVKLEHNANGTAPRVDGSRSTIDLTAD